MKIKVICKQCNEPFMVYPSRVNKRRGNRCKKCCLKGSKVKVICKQCGEPFMVYPSRVRTSEGKFCKNKKCRESRKNRIKIKCKTCGKDFETYLYLIERKNIANCDNCKKVKVKRVKVLCQQCSKEFEVIPSMIKKGGGKYCSNKECKKSRRRVRVNCKQCGKFFETKPSLLKRGGSKFCGKECFKKYNTGENSCLWRGGKSRGAYPQEWTNAFKKTIRDRDNNRCMRCGRAREEFKKALAVHHIDADKNNCNPTNLITLCEHVSGSCHGLTRGKEELFSKGFKNILTRLYGYKYE